MGSSRFADEKPAVIQMSELKRTLLDAWENLIIDFHRNLFDWYRRREYNLGRYDESKIISEAPFAERVLAILLVLFQENHPDFLLSEFELVLPDYIVCGPSYFGSENNDRIRIYRENCRLVVLACWLIGNYVGRPVKGSDADRAVDICRHFCLHGQLDNKQIACLAGFILSKTGDATWTADHKLLIGGINHSCQFYPPASDAIEAIQQATEPPAKLPPALAATVDFWLKHVCYESLKNKVSAANKHDAYCRKHYFEKIDFEQLFDERMLAAAVRFVGISYAKPAPEALQKIEFVLPKYMDGGTAYFADENRSKIRVYRETAQLVTVALYLINEYARGWLSVSDWKIAVDRIDAVLDLCRHFCRHGQLDETQIACVTSFLPAPSWL